MKQLIFLSVLLSCIRLSAQVTVLEEKIDPHKFTCSVTLKNNYNRKIFLTEVNAAHLFQKALGTCGPSRGIVVKSAAKYTFSECSKSPYFIDPATGFAGYIDTVPRVEKLQITPLEIPPHGTQKFEIAFVMELRTCSQFAYTGTVDLVFSTRYKFTKEIRFDDPSYLKAPVTQKEIVDEITRNATTDAWYVQKMQDFEWDKDEAASLITLFAGRIDPDSVVRKPARYYHLKTGEKLNDLEAVAETILALQLRSLSPLVNEYLRKNPDDFMIRLVLSHSEDEKQQAENRRLVTGALQQKLGSPDPAILRGTLDLIYRNGFVELKNDLVTLCRQSGNKEIKDYARFILEGMGVNPDDK